MDEKHVTAHMESMERTSVLANERTYAAWLRTGLTAFAAALAMEKFLGGTIPSHFIRFCSMVFLAMSALCFFLAAWRYKHVENRMVSASVSGAPVSLLCVLSGLLMITSILAIFGLWIKL